MNPTQDLNLMAYMLAILWVAAAYDFKTFKIPNFLTLPGASGAVIYFGFTQGVEGVVFSLIGLAAGVLLLMFPYVMGGMGAGDVKLLGVAGACLGAEAVFGAFLYAALFGGVYALALMVRHRKYFQGVFQHLLFMLHTILVTRRITPVQDDRRPSNIRLKYGLAITAGTTLYVLVKANEINMCLVEGGMP